jgi:hypothetical protein
MFPVPLVACMAIAGQLYFFTCVTSKKITLALYATIYCVSLFNHQSSGMQADNFSQKFSVSCFELYMRLLAVGHAKEEHTFILFSVQSLLSLRINIVS